MKLSLLGVTLAFATSGLANKSCNNLGLQWAFYNNTAGPNYYVNYSTFSPEPYKTTVPVYTAVTTFVGGDYVDGLQTNPISIYGSPTEFYPNNFTLSHKGFLHAPLTGQYTFTVSNVDDIVLIWVGKKAYKTWSRKNADCDAAFSYPEPGPGSCTFSFAAKKRRYTPIRIMYGQSDYSGIADISLTGPDGTVLLDSTTASSPAIVQYSCGHHSHRVKRFPAWGSE